MDRQGMLLCALASGARPEFSPVQLQKLMFLVEMNVAPNLGGPFFAFEPYHYGPFDSGVYDEFAKLERLGLGQSEDDLDARNRRYRLSEEGRAKATEALARLPEATRIYLGELARWVQSLSFAALVSSVYKAYPEMRAKSVFRG